MKGQAGASRHSRPYCAAHGLGCPVRTSCCRPRTAASSREAADIHALLADAPTGVYSALRSYPGRRFLRLGAHLERCRLSVERAGWSTVFDLHTLVRSIDRAAQAYVGGEFRLRLDLLEHPTQRAGVVTQALLALAPHQRVPPEIMRQGAQLGLAPAGLSRELPLVKFTDWVRARSVCETQGINAY